MTGNPRSLAAGLLSLTLTLLLAAWAINEAAQLVLAVWPVLVAAGALVAGTTVAAGYWRSRDRW